MKIDEIMTLEGVSVTEIKEGCYKVAASEGHQIKTGDVYTDSVYMGAAADIDFGVVTDAEAEAGKAEVEARIRAEMEAMSQTASSDDGSSADAGTDAGSESGSDGGSSSSWGGASAADEDGEGGTVLTLEQRVTALEARVGALEADLAALTAQVNGTEVSDESGVMAADD